MGWRKEWPKKAPRPKLKRLSNEQKNEILDVLKQGISASPVLGALGIRVKARRGRFYLEKPWYDSEEEAEVDIIGRVTPIAGKKCIFLLDAKKMNENWYEVMQGTLQEVLNSITNDTRGTFHGLGTLDKSLRKASNGSLRLKIEMHDRYRWIYADTGEECTVQEVLYHVFGVPIPVVAEPREWYVYHRKPKIIEVSEDHKSIVVEFTKIDMYYGQETGNTCIYKQQKGKWEIYE
jgi:hypothetical protein